MRPDSAALSAISRDIGCNGFYPFVVRDDASTEGRMFAPAIGIAEDPVTGNANGPLGAYIARHGLLPHDGRRLSFDGHQGRVLRRDGVVRVMVEIEEGEAISVAIAGDAVQLFSADLRVG
ncbi:PhzF family phenazine biosynthesis isomerase [Massilia sp. BJB1822]|uniref:PhzF family phenazine biosynthesis isomerase n=1 Tax=Massilia sp. BJB1822 TaxID=2744470 RepID=UPI0035A67701